MRNSLKRTVARMGTNVAVSRAVAECLPKTTTVIPNAFRPLTGYARDSENQRKELLFVGRLVSEKGCDIALKALARLHAWGEQLSLKVCGDGPERVGLQRQVESLGLRSFVSFAGWSIGEQLAKAYAAAEVLLVPSRNETFGIVALEGIAAGCGVVAARTGGLPEAVGPCGLLFEPEDADDLAEKIMEVRRPGVRETLLARAAGHLAEHEIERVAQRYLEVLERAVNGRR